MISRPEEEVCARAELTSLKGLSREHWEKGTLALVLTLKMLVAPGKSIRLGLCISGVRFRVVSKCSEESPGVNPLPHFIVGKTWSSMSWG